MPSSPAATASLAASPAAPRSPEELSAALKNAGYLASLPLARGVWLALQLQRPLLIEGPAGVGKTDLARALSQALDAPLVRLQCYEGLDESRALFEWNYPKQILYTQLLRDTLASKLQGMNSLEDAMQRLSEGETSFFSERFLIERPVLQALRSPKRAVLLLDEVDRADPELEAFFLEVLAEQQVTLPELGTLHALHPPIVLLTTNGTRELTDALRRRCLHLFVDYPPPSQEIAILQHHLPHLEEKLSQHLVAFVAELRKLELRKAPSIGESLDWARALLTLGASSLDSTLAQDATTALLKYQEDRLRVSERWSALVASSAQAAPKIPLP